MVLDIMSGPPLPSRAVRGSSQKGRPLPSTPQDSAQSVASIKDRKLPPPPTESSSTSFSPSRGGSSHVQVPSTLDISGQNPNKRRPLPPPPAEEQISSPIKSSAHNTHSTLRHGSPRSPRTPVESAQNGHPTLGRGLPRTPVGNTSVNNLIDNAKRLQVKSTPVKIQGQSDTLKRPLPPPPVEEPVPALPPSNRPMKSKTLDVPPQLPVRKTSLHDHLHEEPDFEVRFKFHDVRDFPPPDEFEDKPKKKSSESTQTANQRRKRTSPR